MDSMDLQWIPWIEISFRKIPRGSRLIEDIQNHANLQAQAIKKIPMSRTQAVCVSCLYIIDHLQYKLVV